MVRQRWEVKGPRIWQDRDRPPLQPRDQILHRLGPHHLTHHSVRVYVPSLHPILSHGGLDYLIQDRQDISLGNERLEENKRRMN